VPSVLCLPKNVSINYIFMLSRFPDKDLEWLGEEAGFLLWGEAMRRRELLQERRYSAA